MFNKRSIVALGLSALAFGSANAQNYTGCDHFTASNFFSEFDFFSQLDPTHGFVSYQNAEQANANGLAGYSDGGTAIFLGTDYLTLNPPLPGRGSTRVSSKKNYTEGLFIFDVKHMPTGCSLWPAIWTLGVGTEWPSAGEIDIIEGVNRNTGNLVTLHTSDGCVVSATGSLPSSNLTSSPCGANGGFEGCPITTESTLGYGEGFNANGGGVYAMEWTSTSIRVFFFPRNAIPATITNSNEMNSPDVSLFGTPVASFSGPGCDIPSHFKDHQIIINTSLCGDFAGKPEIWGNSSCSALAPTCQDYAANAPAGTFSEAYWEINSIKVYQDYSASPGYTKTR